VLYGNGYGWQVNDLPYLLRSGTNEISISTGAGGDLSFTQQGNAYLPQHASTHALARDPTNDVFTLTMDDGALLEFYGFDQATAPKGAWKRTQRCRSVQGQLGPNLGTQY